MNRLFLDDEVLRTGGVGVVLEGGPPFHTVVSQGCRPIGTPFVVTRGERCVIWELGGEPPLTRLQELFPTLDERDQKLVQRGLHVGIVMNEYQEKFRSGDFLISNVAGIDESIGAMVIAGGIRTGQTVQFHVRDAVTADEELRAMLRAVAAGSPGARIGGGLVFSCNGRGTKLFEEPHHDAQAVADQFGRVPLAGFFAMGELGPVGPRSYIHGFTASIALFETDGT
jgi:small ligand-binding sensory domain FIST